MSTRNINLAGDEKSINKNKIALHYYSALFPLNTACQRLWTFLSSSALLTILKLRFIIIIIFIYFYYLSKPTLPTKGVDDIIPPPAASPVRSNRKTGLTTAYPYRDDPVNFYIFSISWHTHIHIFPWTIIILCFLFCIICVHF